MELFLWLVAIVLVVVWLGIVWVGPPYVPTHQKQLDQLFDQLNIGKDDHVVDLGAGDGRVLLAAVRRGAAASGVASCGLMRSISTSSSGPLPSASAPSAGRRITSQ